MSEILLFNVGGIEVFGLNVLEVREIMAPDKMHQLPNSHPSILGCVSVRGATVPVLDLASVLFNRPPSSSKGLVIILDIEVGAYGLKVEEVHGITHLLLQDAQSKDMGRRFIDGIIKHTDGSLVQLLNVSRLLAQVNVRAMAA